MAEELDPIELTPEQRKELRLQARRAVGHVSERLHFVLLFSRGHSPAEIAALYEVDERTVVTWLERFRSQGTGGLSDLPRSGRPRRARGAAEAEATRCLEAGSPEQMGARRTTWTRKLLRQHLGERFNCWLSRSSLTRLIHRLEFGWRRPKLALKMIEGGQEERAGMRAILAIVRGRFPAAPLLFGDECDVHELPVVRGQYQRKGEQREVPTPGTNRKQPVFGFLNGNTGQWHYFLPPRRRSREFIACLHQLAKEYPTGPVFLLVDHGSIHQSEATLRWLERHPRFVLLHLPRYSGHKCNPVEKVWWALKDEVAANRLYPSLEAVQDAIHGFFATFTPAAAQQLAGAYVPAPAPATDLALAA